MKVEYIEPEQGYFIISKLPKTATSCELSIYDGRKLFMVMKVPVFPNEKACRIQDHFSHQIEGKLRITCKAIMPPKAPKKK